MKKQSVYEGNIGECIFHFVYVYIVEITNEVYTNDEHVITAHTFTVRRKSMP